MSSALYILAAAKTLACTEWIFFILSNAADLSCSVSNFFVYPALVGTFLTNYCISTLPLIFVNLQTGGECVTTLVLGSFFTFLNSLIFLTANNKTFLHTLIYAELCYLGIILMLSNEALFSGLFDGQVYALIMVTLAAAESALGLGVTIAIFRLYKVIDLHCFSILKN